MPCLEALYGVAQSGQFDVGVHGMHVTAPAVAHEFLADVGDDADFGKARVEGVAEVVEAVMREPGAAERALPRGLDPMDRPLADLADQLSIDAWIETIRR